MNTGATMCFVVSLCWLAVGAVLWWMNNTTLAMWFVLLAIYLIGAAILAAIESIRK